MAPAALATGETRHRDLAACEAAQRRAPHEARHRVNITALVDGLEEERLVRRLPHPTDRRATVIELTGEGGRTMGTLYDRHRGAVAELFVGLSERDRRGLLRLVGLPREGLRGEGGSC